MVWIVLAEEEDDVYAKLLTLNITTMKNAYKKAKTTFTACSEHRTLGQQ
jgi:hypothetical protein